MTNLPDGNFERATGQYTPRFLQIGVAAYFQPSLRGLADLSNATQDCVLCYVQQCSAVPAGLDVMTEFSHTVSGVRPALRYVELEK
jgi:hypothetical protein